MASVRCPTTISFGRMLGIFFTLSLQSSLHRISNWRMWNYRQRIIGQLLLRAACFIVQRNGIRFPTYSFVSIYIFVRRTVPKFLTENVPRSRLYALCGRQMWAVIVKLRSKLTLTVEQIVALVRNNYRNVVVRPPICTVKACYNGTIRLRSWQETHWRRLINSVGYCAINIVERRRNNPASHANFPNVRFNLERIHNRRIITVEIHIYRNYVDKHNNWVNTRRVLALIALRVLTRFVQFVF